MDGEVSTEIRQHIGTDIVKLAYDFRLECRKNGVLEEKKDFLIGIIFGMKVFVTIEYKEGQSLKEIT